MVLVKEMNDLKLEKYVLSLSAPKEKFKDVIEMINQTNDKENMTKRVI